MLTPVVVELDWYEMDAAIAVAARRQTFAKALGLKDTADFIDLDGTQGFRNHLLGAGGENAVAKAFNLYWSHSNGTFQSPDVAQFHVRTGSPFIKGKNREEDCGMIIRPDDLEHYDGKSRWVQVTAIPPEFKIWGWCFLREAKEYGEWTDFGNGRAKCLLVPRSRMRPLNTLYGPEPFGTKTKEADLDYPR